MKALGIGVRVYVSWTTEAEHEGLTCQTGTIIKGPFPAGFEVYHPQDPHSIFVLRHTSWMVMLDRGTDILAGEPVLHPIDEDPDGEVLTVDEEEAVEA